MDNMQLQNKIQQILDETKEEGEKLLDDFKKSLKECEQKIIKELSETKKEEE